MGAGLDNLTYFDQRDVSGKQGVPAETQGLKGHLQSCIVLTLHRKLTLEQLLPGR